MLHSRLTISPRITRLALYAGTTLLTAGSAVAQDDKIAALEAAVKSAQTSGDNAWMLTSAALVLMMTGPGLALFYGGLVRKKNVLSIFMQCFVTLAVVSVIWVLWGYSIAFGTDIGGFAGSG